MIRRFHADITDECEAIANKCILCLPLDLHAFILVMFTEFSVTSKYWFQYASESGWQSELLKHLKFT